jgi:hypothetical protein
MQEKVTILKAGLKYKLPKFLENKVYEYAAFLLNRLPTIQTRPENPWEKFTGQPFNLNLNPLLPFGQVAVFHTDKSLRTNKRQRGNLGIFVGKRADIPKGYEVFMPSTSTIVIRYGKWTPAEIPVEWNLKVNPFKAAKGQVNNPYSISNDENYMEAEIDPSDRVSQSVDDSDEDVTASET